MSKAATTSATTGSRPAAAAANAAGAEDMDVEDDVDEEKTEVKAEEDTTIGNSKVLEKYKASADIVNNTLTTIQNACRDGKSIYELCAQGDTMINDGVKGLYSRDKSVSKGIAFPMSISVNNLVGHYSPISTDTATIKAGDLVKIDVAAHIDGYVATGATTFVCPTPEKPVEPITGRVADLITALNHAESCVIRTIRPGAKSTAVTDCINKVAAAFKVSCVQGVLSHVIERYVIDGAKVILNRADSDVIAEEFVFGTNQVYAIDIVFSTAEVSIKLIIIHYFLLSDDISFLQ